MKIEDNLFVPNKLAITFYKRNFKYLWNGINTDHMYITSNGLPWQQVAQ
jgi:hypothetical protein